MGLGVIVTETAEVCSSPDEPAYADLPESFA